MSNESNNRGMAIIHNDGMAIIGVGSSVIVKHETVVICDSGVIPKGYFL